VITYFYLGVFLGAFRCSQAGRLASKKG